VLRRLERYIHLAVAKEAGAELQLDVRRQYRNMRESLIRGQRRHAPRGGDPRRWAVAVTHAPTRIRDGIKSLSSWQRPVSRPRSPRPC